MSLHPEGEPDESRETLLANLDKHRRGCDAGGSPFYARLLELMIEDVAAGGPTWGILQPYAAEPLEPVYPLRLLGGLHRLALTRRSAALATHFPSTGGDGDADAAWPVVRATFADPPQQLVTSFDRAVQTNEVARSVALVGGLLEIADRTDRPVRLLEVGSSGGLLLRADHYWFEQHGRGWGEPTSSLRFVDRFEQGSPPFGAPLSIVDRRGCDRDPIDAADDAGRVTLLSYVWPGTTARFDAISRALDVARDVPVPIDRADAADWVEAQVSQPSPGVTTVIWHSIVWQYLDDATRARITSAIAAAGADADASCPVAWLRLEPTAHAFAQPELRLQLWPDGSDEVLAVAGFHQQPVRWLA